MTPEQKARQEIDRKLDNAGWKVCNRDEFSPAVSALAVREGIMQGGLEADYLLFIKGKAVAVLEAKRLDVDLVQTAAAQAENYTKRLPEWCQAWHNPLKIIYLSNGNELLYKNRDGEITEYQLITQMHTPKELARLAAITDEFAGLPYLNPKGLRKCQFEAISALENSFCRGERRALMVLATGAGKTFTACMAAYRLLSYTSAKRILFLVDRNNLGKQAEGEFGTFRLTENGEPFNTIFVTERLKSPDIPSDSNVVISTIQRIFAVLTGQDFADEDEVEGIQTDDTPVEIGANLNLPKDFFDYVVVDECHRSIYGKWQQVLNYFETARIIGLTATPAPETLAFFNNNLIINYTLEKSIADGINVDYRVFRIKTKVSEEGGKIDENQRVIEQTNYTGEVRDMVAEETATYGNTELDRSVINPEQIRLVLDTFKNIIYAELFPDRERKIEYIPKSLIFAKSDAHASRIVEIAKTVFENQHADFIQKITYSAGDSNELIRRFRNNKTFRIAVTVNLVATGTDIKPLEILLFMRDVQSEVLYTQMKGRGCRIIGDEQLRNVTPNATSKDLFYIVDAVGVTEHEKRIPRPTGADLPPNPSLEILLEKISHGYLPDAYLHLLSARLFRIHYKSKVYEQNLFAEKAGISMYDLATNLYTNLDANVLPEFIDVSQPNTERKALVRPLAENPDARKYLLVLNAGFTKILVPGEDELIYKGFSEEEAKSTTQAFEEYVASHKDEIEALRIIYNNRKDAINYNTLKDLQEKLLSTDSRFSILRLWNSYSITQTNKVVKLKQESDRDCLTNIIQLVRFAFHIIPELKSLPSRAEQYFNLWCGQNQRPLTENQKLILKEIVGYIVANGTYSSGDLREDNMQIYAQLVQSFGSPEIVNETLESLNNWLLAA
ncbi:MAG: DEAD/DEAH box helicase family protein [Bacteroidales bacterium]|jgi:type I restriction enzyme R subunit|nr:DEAD/DEAH box helicase family protein [Bacteroidales bacterium]